MPRPIFRGESPFTDEMLRQVKEQAPWLLQPARRAMTEDYRVHSSRWGKEGPGIVKESYREEDIPLGSASTLRGVTTPSEHAIDVRRGSDSIRVLAHEIGHVASLKYGMTHDQSEAMADLLAGEPDWAVNLKYDTQENRQAIREVASHILGSYVEFFQQFPEGSVVLLNHQLEMERAAQEQRPMGRGRRK
jgi:hypothetical protein